MRRREEKEKKKEGGELFFVLFLFFDDDALSTDQKETPSSLSYHEQHLQPLAPQLLQERRRLHRLARLSRDVVDSLLALLHPGDVVFKGGLLLSRLGRVVAQEVGEPGPVGRVLVDAQLEVLGERVVELGVVVLVLGDLGEQLEALLDQVLADDLEDLVLLQGLARDVEREVLGVDDAADEAEPLRDQFLAVVLLLSLLLLREGAGE